MIHEVAHSFRILLNNCFQFLINILTWLIKDNLQQKTIMLLLKGTDITVVSRVTFSIISNSWVYLNFFKTTPTIWRVH